MNVTDVLALVVFLVTYLGIEVLFWKYNSGGEYNA